MSANYVKYKSGVYLTLILVILCLLASGLRASESLADSGRGIVHQLESGGFNIYFRHAETDWAQNDNVEEWGDWTSCNPLQIRQLSDTGRENATRVGKAIRTLNIPVGKVVASPYCRSMETAELMKLGPVEPSNEIINLRVADYFGGMNAVLETARQKLASLPASGTNTILVAHGNIARSITPVYPNEAEGVVVRPDGAGGYEYVARLNPDQWEQLAKMMSGQGLH